jgi:hypothetical protein
LRPASPVKGSGRLDGHRFALARATGPAGLSEQTSGTTTETSIVLGNGEIRGTMAETRPRKCLAVLVSDLDRAGVCDGVRLSQPTCGPPSWARRVAISVTARPM